MCSRCVCALMFTALAFLAWAWHTAGKVTAWTPPLECPQCGCTYR